MNSELTNRFSWHRFGMVARFYYPRLKKQIILYPALSLFSMLLTIATVKLTFIPYGFLTPLSMLGTLLLWLGPAVFITQEGRETETLLPAKGSEKALFIMLYSIVGIPVLISLFSFISSYYNQDLVEKILTSSNVRADMDVYSLIDRLRNNVLLRASSLLISVFPCLITLFVIMRARYHRIVWAVVWNVVYFVSAFILTFIAGFWAAMSHDLMNKSAAIAQNTTTPEAVGAITDMIPPIITTIFSIIGAYTLVCSVVLLILTYRAIVNRQAV